LFFCQGFYEEGWIPVAKIVINRVMRILLVGSGGREHALAWKLKQSSRCTHLICAPGNAGIAQIVPCAAVAVDDIDGLVALARAEQIDFVVVGPEIPLVLGLADRLTALGIPVFGPSAKAAQLEGSKGFTKDLCKKYAIPTAAYERFTAIAPAHDFIDRMGAPIVIKADGLAAGKGVVVAMTVAEAKDAVDDMLSGNAFGASGASVVIEEFMEGEEVSYFALTDGTHILPLTTAQDHKRVGDGDVGPNTGGMGAYSPARLMTPELDHLVIETILKPTVAGMAKEGAPFQGVLYAGLMVHHGKPRLVEYNARFGDPECQTLMLRLQSDLVELLYACAKGRLDTVQPVWSDAPSLCVVMAAEGYPGAYQKNTVIRGLDAAAAVPQVQIFHAGTAEKDQHIVATSGRVLGVCAVGPNVVEARKSAYAAVDAIDWPEGFCRRDIAWRAVEE
jgi:phosphoribosylamine--glycine ligase